MVLSPTMSQEWKSATEGTQHAAEAPIRAGSEIEGAACIEGARSQGQDAQLDGIRPNRAVDIAAYINILKRSGVFPRW
jgi:hypothetical protein